MIAIIAAMSKEVKEVVLLMENAKEEQHSGFTFYQGTLSDVEIVVLECGIGKVAAAMGTTVLLEHYDVSAIINTGVAGGLLKQQEVLDVVVSTKVAHHDIEGPVEFFQKGYDNNPYCYLSDDGLVQVVTSILQETQQVFVGPIASGDSFVYTEQQVDKILKEFPESICAEMEAAGIAQVCSHYRKPFVVIRSLSDVACKEGNELEYNEFVVLASKRGAQWCEKFMKELKNKQ